MKIFLYLKSCKLTKTVLAKLEKNGYLPIQVNSLEEVRIVEAVPTLSGQDMDAVTGAALRTILNDAGFGCQQNFAKALCKLLLPKYDKPSPPPAP